MTKNSKQFYEFGPFRLDAVEQQLWREEDEIALTPKAFGVLLLLIRNSGHAVTKEDFMREVWPDTIVEEKNLTDNISSLRQALGDSPQAQRYIKTVPRRGYRFVAEVRETGGEVIEIVDRRKTHIVIEETDVNNETDAAITPGAKAERPSVPPPAATRTIWLQGRFLLPVAMLLALVSAGAIWVIRSGRDTRRSPLPMMQTIQFTSFNSNEFAPALSPDGTMVAFSRHDGEDEDIFVQQVGAVEALRLTHTRHARNGSATWSPDGLNIAFIRETPDRTGSGIFTVPPLGGPERKLFSLEKYRAHAGLDWSPDGKQLVFTARASDREPFSLHLLSLETQELRRLTWPVSVTDTDNRMAFSPDGQFIAFVRSMAETGDVHVVAATGGAPRRVTSDNRSVLGVSWTSDGRHIVFSSNRSGSNYLLWKVPVTGGTPEPLPLGGDNAVSPHVSRAGNRLVFARATSDTNIYRAALNEDPGPKGPATLLITSTRHDGNAALSPDGRRIAFESGRTGSSEIWMTDSEGQKPVQLTHFKGPSITNPSWSPDAQEVAFQSRIEGKADIYVVSADGGSPRRLTTESSNELSPAWSRDGRWVYFSSDRTGTYQVWKIPSGGGVATQVTHSGGFEAAESADGQFLYYTKYHTNGIFRAPAGGGEEAKVFDLPELDSWGDWYLTKDGIYFLDRKNLPRTSFQFFDFTTGRVRDVLKLEKDPGQHPGLNVSSDNRTLIYSRCDVCNYDIMLVENFR